MRDHLVRAYLDVRKGHRTTNDEGHSKDRRRPSEIAAINKAADWPFASQDLGVSPVESRAGQYMRRLRRLGNKGRDR